MSDNLNHTSFDDIQIYVKRKEEHRFKRLISSASTPMLNMNDQISSVTEKSVQVNMDCDPGEDPKKNKKYWQDLAGLRGAQEEYLRYDLREALGANSHLNATIDFLTKKLLMADKQIKELKKQKCRCQEQLEYVHPPYRGLCL